MRKLILAAVGAMTLFMAFPLYAAEVKFGGEFRVRGFFADNLLDGNSGLEDANRFNDLRFRLKTSITAGATTGVVVLDFGNCFFGADVATINGPGAVGAGAFTGDCRFGAGGAGRSYNTVGVREAHLNIDLKTFRAILGRQTLKLGHGIVFDDTADAITVVIPMGDATLTGSLLQLADETDGLGAALPTDINSDTSVWVLNLGMDHGNHVLNVYNAFLYDQASGGVTTFNTIYPTGVVGAGVFGAADKIWYNIVGVSLDVKNGPMALAAEGTYTMGTISNGLPGVDIRLKGWNLMGDVTVDTGGSKVGATVVYAAGTDQGAVSDATANDISGNFQLGNIILNSEQFADRDGGSLGGGLIGMGILAVKGHISTPVSDKLTVGGALIYARTAELCAPLGGALPCGGMNDREIGTEVDLNAAYAVDGNLTLSAGAGYLFTGDGAQDFYAGAPAGGGADSPIWKLAGRAVFTF